MRWRKLIRDLHRDIGYAVAALVIAYSISGLAVNHIEDWNPNYAFQDIAVNTGPLPAGSLGAMEAQVVERLALDPGEVRGRFMASDTELRVFLPEGQEVRVDVRSGRGIFKRVDTRAVLYEVNMLHLNSIKGAWTWVADIFAVALLILALTGIFLNKGRHGIAGRGKWLLGIGLLIPVLFIVYIYHGAAIGTGH